MREEFKEFMKDCTKSILFYTFVYSILFFVSKLILNILGLEFMQYVYKFSIFIILFGIVLGVIQNFIRSKSKNTRICIIVCSISIISICALFWQFFALLYIGFFPPEHIIEKSDKKMVGYVHAFLETRVEYFEYINVLVRKANKSYVEDYGEGGFDPFDKKIGYKHEVQEITYYDENGKVISTNNINNPIILDSNKQEINREEFKEEIKEENSETRYISEEDILYEKVIDENTRIRVVNLGAILAQRSVIDIEKSTDNGKTYVGQTEEGITIHNGAEFVFLDENIGFINDSGLAGTGGENRGFLATTDGGKTFSEANIIHPLSIEEKNLLVKGVPYIKDGKLNVQIYTLNHSKYPERTYYEFTSNNGLTWKYNYETVYTSEQLKKYEKDFNTFGINGFIVSTNTYNKPSEIDLEEVFYSGAGFNNEISKEELEEYKKVTKYHETDMVKITTKQAEELYYNNTGEKLWNLKERLKNWTYIEKYDAYYNEVSDTNFESVSCIEGIMNEEHKIMKIQLSNNRTISVKIDYDKGTHYIISNKSTN